MPTYSCAVINDFSGFGRCSISVALPVISAMGIQCCSVPTAILSNHTGYPDYFFDSYTEKMPAYISKLKGLNLKFDTIYSGFLGCEKQIDIVRDFILSFKGDKGRILVDPVMGDNGKIYTTYSDEMCKKMRDLAELADIITPNVTEACILTDSEYKGEALSQGETFGLLDALSLGGKRSVLITGIVERDKIKTAVFDSQSGEKSILINNKTEKSFPGTGDLFASILCGAVTRGRSLLDAATLAADFVQKATHYTAIFDTDVNDGIAFEPFLYLLTK